MRCSLTLCSMAAAAGVSCAPQQGWPPLEAANAISESSRPAELPRYTMDLLAAEDRLWLVGSRGELISTSVTGGAPVSHLEEHEVVDIHRTPSGRLWALVIDGRSDDARVVELRAGVWVPILQWTASRYGPLAMTDLDERPIVVSSDAAIYEARGELVVVPLTHPIDRYWRLHMAPAKDARVYLAADWVGVMMIDLSSGEVTLQGCPNEDGHWIPGGWAGACSAVPEMVADPVEKGCVYAAFSSGGGAPEGDEIVHLCGESRRILDGPWTRMRFHQRLDIGELIEGRQATSKASERSSRYPCFDDIRECRRGVYADHIKDLAVRGPAIVVLTASAVIEIEPAAEPLVFPRSTPLGSEDAERQRLCAMGYARCDAVLSSMERFAGSVVVTIANSSHIVAVDVADRLEAGGPTAPRGCYWVDGQGELCFAEQTMSLERDGSRREVPVTWRPVEPHMLEGTTSFGEKLLVQFWGDTLLVSRRNDALRFGVYANRAAVTATHRGPPRAR